jgi:hypothetical protein
MSAADRPRPVEAIHIQPKASLSANNQSDDRPTPAAASASLKAVAARTGGSPALDL